MVERPATSADVARLAGVSRTTVSNVLNNTPTGRASAETRQRVIAAALQLGHTPNAAARSLRSGNSQVVLALMPDWDMGPTFSAGLQALNALFASNGYILVIHSHSAGVRPLSALWADFRPAVVMVFGALADDDALSLKKTGIAFREDIMRDFLFGITRLQADHLHRAGHDRLGYVVPSHFVPREITEYRGDALKDFCRARALAEPYFGVLDYGEDGREECMRELLSQVPPVTGVVAHTDELAAFIWGGARESADDDRPFSIVGVGDRPIANIGITTVAFDFEAVARYWAEPVLALLEKREIATDLEFPGWIEVRQSA